MIKRRQFIKQGLLAAVGSGLLPVGTGAQSKPKGGPDFFTGLIPELQPLGTHTPKDPELTRGDELILSSPKSKPPFEIMSYFAALTDTNGDGEAYNAGWRERYNPVIVRFFDCADRRPSGDETFWCAACLNWVLARSGFVGTCSSSSSSFRHGVGTKTDDPQPGDIVVFRHKNKKLADVGRGHVGLFVSRTTTSVTVLGGNQKRAGHHAVCEQVIDGQIPLVLDSFISVDSLVKLGDPDKPCPCKPPVNRYLQPTTHKK
jgi:uncharacterized protein (TIGR02594 family)